MLTTQVKPSKMHYCLLLQNWFKKLFWSASEKLNCILFWVDDETTDLSIRKQIVLAVRYVWEGTIREDVVCIRDLMETLTDIIGKDSRPTSSENADIHLSGKNTAKVICNMVLKLKLNAENMVSQSFDGASVMKSPEVGVATEIQRNFSISADYIHCLMHCTNLVAKQPNKLPTIPKQLPTKLWILCVRRHLFFIQVRKE